MKTIIFLILLSISIQTNAQVDRILHSATLDCYIDLGKIVGIGGLYNKWDGFPKYGYELRYGPDRDWRFTIIYEFRDNRTFQFYADSAKAQQVYYRIVRTWKAYVDPTPPPIPKDIIILMLEQEIAYMDSISPHIRMWNSPDPWGVAIKTSKEIIKLLNDE